MQVLGLEQMLNGNYWVGPKVHSGFPVTSYGKTRTNFLANPILFVVRVYLQGPAQGILQSKHSINICCPSGNLDHDYSPVLSSDLETIMKIAITVTIKHKTLEKKGIKCGEK